MPYEVEFNENDELMVNGKVIGQPYLDYDALIDLTGPNSSDYLKELLNEIDPDGNLPEKLVPIFAGIAYRMIMDFWNIAERMVNVTDFAKTHKHVEKTIAVVE